jgi:uncharacterized C2H2 Zn-finger protein
MGSIFSHCKKKDIETQLAISGRYCYKCDLLFTDKIQYNIHMNKNHNVKYGDL